MQGQRGCVVRKGSSYFIKYRLPSGKQKMEGSRPGHGFRTHDEAQARLHGILDEINRGSYVEKKSIKFGAFAGQWIEGRVSIGGSTESAYGSVIRKHLVPHLGHFRVHEIQLANVQSMVAKMASKRSRKSLENAVTLLRVMLVGKKGPSAIKLGYLRHDPTLGLELPPKLVRETQPPTPEQVWMLVETAEEMSKENVCAKVAHDIIFVDAFTGLRRGEILALQFRDVDWFAREIVVSRAIVKVKAEDGVHKWDWKVGATKGKKTRRVGVGERVLRMLAELKQSATDKDGFIFTPELAELSAGRYPFVEPDLFNASVYGPIAAAAKLTNVRFHDLRHFFASMLINQGESAKYVCDQLGHSSIQVTFDTYGHLFPQSRREASDKLEQSMFAKRQERVEKLVENARQDGSGDGEGSRPN
jgi:integrase